MRTLRKLIFLVFVKTMVRCTISGWYTSKLYPFGKEAGDSPLPVQDDVSSDAISTPPFHFFELKVESFYVHENGIISFGSSLKSQEPSSFPLDSHAYVAAPYWADVYTKRGGRVWYRVTTEQAIISRAARDVIRAFPRDTKFVANWVAIVTWNEVSFYGASGIYTKNTNTFQVVIAGGEHMTFVSYIYDNLSWTTDTLNGGNKRGLGGKAAKVGFSFGSSYQNVPFSGSKELLSLVNRTNCGQPGIWLFKVDNEQDMNEKRCETSGTVSIHSAGGKLNSGSNILITGLCYWPGTELRCEFGDIGVAKGYKVNETKAICTVPLLPTRKQQSVFYIYPNENDDLRFAQEFDLEPVFLDDTTVQRKAPDTWTTGNRVNITWNVSDLAADLPVTIEIINLSYNHSGREFHNYTTVVFSQPNTGKAEFDLPLRENLRKNPSAPETLQMVRVRSLVGNSYNKFVAREWIGSELFLLTNQTAANGSCSSWLQNQTHSLMITSNNHLTPCPKTRRQMNADIGIFREHDLCDTNILPLCKFYYRKVKTCYKTTVTSDRGITRACCYDKEGELTAGPPGEFVNRNKHAVTSGSIFLSIWDKIIPYLQCCMFSNNCFKYQELTTSEARYLPPNIGAAFGDPHIQTLDGVEYTFNGFGEYTVLNVDNTRFLLQGRMQPLKGEKSGEAPATVFTAFAMKEQKSSLIQMQLNERQTIDILVDRKLVIFDHELQSRGVLIKNSLRENNPRVIAAFTSGITVYVENAAPVLQMAVVVPVKFKGKTSGLLGYWDDNSDKEYLLPNNEVLSTASTMSELHYKFGQQWVTKEIDSLFMYGPEEAHRDFFDPSYIPTFMEGYHPITSKMKSGMKKRALKTCDHSFQCIFDIAITGRFGIGQATREFQEWLMGMKRDLHDEGCNVVLSLDRGSVRRDVSGDQVTHHFTCNNGYTMVGKDKMSCRGGVWDGSKPTCIKASKGCEQFSTSFKNGHFTGQGNKAGDRYKFQCDSSYTLVGKNEIVCENGEWSGEVPSCKAKCSQIKLNNSQVTIGNGGQLIIQCNPGYTLSGSRVISCLNGLLNGTLPSCTKGYNFTAPILKASEKKKDSMIVIVIGVLVLFIAILVIMLTIYLVRKHHRRKDTQEQKKPDEDDNECVAL